MNLNDNVLDLTKRSLQNELVILNLREMLKEDLQQSVINTLNTIGVTHEIDFEVVYRRGPPRMGPDDTPRPVIVRLHRRDTVEKILKKARDQRGSDRSQPKIVPHLPEELRQQRVKLGHIAHKKWEADNNAKIKVKSDHVQVNGQKIADTVKLLLPNKLFS
jgi:hypothetical protein